jgi:Flp pilus assembly protein TadG
MCDSSGRAESRLPPSFDRKGKEQVSYNNCVRRSVVVPHRARYRQDGSTVVEFAVVFPLFFVLVMCAIEGGRFVVAKMMLSYAVSVGARAATLTNAKGDSTTGSVQDIVVKAAPMLSLTPGQVEITSGGVALTLPAAVGTNVTVSIGVANSANKYQFTSFVPRYFSPFTSRTWSAQATMVAR